MWETFTYKKSTEDFSAISTKYVHIQLETSYPPLLKNLLLFRIDSSAGQWSAHSMGLLGGVQQQQLAREINSGYGWLLVRCGRDR